MSKVTVDVNWARLAAEMRGNVAKAQTILDNQVVKDCTPYVPFDQGILSGSGHPERPGVVVWDEPYAAAQFYGLPNKSRDSHPLATMNWFAAAKSVCKGTWLRVARAAGGRR